MAKRKKRASSAPRKQTTPRKKTGSRPQPPLHPDPQFARDNWVSLDGRWAFHIDVPGRIENPQEVDFDRQIQVPFAPETPESGVNFNGYFNACWYRRTFERPTLEQGQRLILRFNAVDHRATVYVNGHVACAHEGGYTGFHCDITDYLADGEQTLVVRAEDDPHDLTKPRGKQDWQLDPHSIWYPRTTGIWQSVWLELVGESWVERLRWVPDLERFEIGLWAHIARAEHRKLYLNVRLTSGSRLLAEDRYKVADGEVHRAIRFSDPGIDDYRNELLWSPDRPVLIQAHVELADEDGRVLDALRSYTAMRSVGVLGDRFMLNGRPLYLRLVLDQGYWPGTGLTPPDDAAARRDVELARAMGFNGVRAHQRIADPRYLYFADVLGLLVWGEMPSPYRFTSDTVVRLTREWAEAIDRDRSHPCVVAWVPMNESWGVPDLPSNEAHRQTVRAMYHLTHALDSTRPVVGNDGWEMEVTDIIAIHDYERNPERMRNRYADARDDPQRTLDLERPGYRVLLLSDNAYHGQPIMLTEFGGIALRERGTWGYAQVEGPAALAQQYEQLLAAVHESRVFSGFCYTQFADTYQEANGLLRADRTPKFELKQMRAATLGEGQGPAG